MNHKEYLFRLQDLYNRVPNKFEKEIFWYICKKYQDFIKKRITTKNCTKEEIIKHLIDKGLMSMSIDKTTKEEKLPDDRTVRSAVRKLMKNGLPILSSSTVAGYYICDNTREIIQPYNENKKRALKLLTMQKSFDKMSEFVSGQLEITEIDLSSVENDNY